MKKTLSSARISNFCYELSLILKAGIPLSEGIAMLAEGERDKELKQSLTKLGESLELGEAFTQALRASALFPPYLLEMCGIGEQTGKLEQVLAALSVYYERRESIAKTVKNAVIYPLILLVMMLFVIVLLVTKVMPIFADVFAQLGGSMSPMATAILRFGEWLNRRWMIPAAVVAVMAAAAVVCAKLPAAREKLASLTFSWKLSKTVASAQFASAMALTMAGGLTMEESLTMAQKVASNKKMRAAIGTCRELCESGSGFGDAVIQSGVLQPMDAQLLAIGLRTGNGDTVMEEIARRGEQAVAEETETVLARVEPAIVVFMTVLVAVILISVMLPLMSIMATL